MDTLPMTTTPSYDNSGRLYFRGACSFAKSLPTVEGRYEYSLRVSPGTQEHHVGNVQIGGGSPVVTSLTLNGDPDELTVNESYRTYDRPNRRRDQDENPYTGLRPTGAAANSSSGDVDTRGVHEEINPGGTQQTSSDSRTYDCPSRRRDQDTNPYTGLRPTGAARGVHEEINPGGTQQTSSDSRTYDRPSRRRDQDTNLYTGLRPTGAAASRTSGDIDTRGVYEEINPGGTQQTSS
ncbi:hypothetical protein BaRGS_00028050, partial [Batillaria attramentaria]